MVLCGRDAEDSAEVFVHHAAGMGGWGGGGSSYIDSVILRDRDPDLGDDSTERTERRFYCQNWRADVSAIITHDGKMVEWIKYSAYGEPTSLPAGDTDGDYDWDATDSANISGSMAYKIREDTDLNGTVAAADVTHANSITGGYQTLGRGVLTSSGVENRIGYAGYRYDPRLGSTGRHWYHVRNRVYMAEVGRWMTRDPLGYINGLGLYQYVVSAPLRFVDPYGLAFECPTIPSVCCPGEWPELFPDTTVEDCEEEAKARLWAALGRLDQLIKRGREDGCDDPPFLTGLWSFLGTVATSTVSS